MPQAIRSTSILTMLDAIAPNRQRFTFINGSRKPKTNTLALIDRIAADLAAQHGAPIQVLKGPRNPYVNHYGKITDPEKAALWDMAQRKGGVL